MKKASLSISLFLLTTLGFAQISQRDSINLIRDSLKLKIERAKHLATGCSDFEIRSNPVWAGDNPDSKTYYKNCMWSGTYIVINPDSTFLYKHNGEGPANYLQKGNWSIYINNILILKGNETLTKEFIIKMMQFEKRNYKSSSPFLKKFIIQQHVLLEFDQ